MQQSSVIESIAEKSSASVDALLRILQHDPARLLHRLRSWVLPPELVEAAIAHPQHKVRLAIAENVNVPAETRARLVDDAVWVVRAVCAVGPSAFRMDVEPLPEWAQRKLLADPDERVREEARGYSLRLTIAAELHDDPDPRSRAVACRAWDLLDDATCLRLLADEDERVRRAAASRAARHDPDATEIYLSAGSSRSAWWHDRVLETAAIHLATAERLVRTGGIAERAALAVNPAVPKELALELASDDERFVRVMTASRPDLTEDERAAIDYTVTADDRFSILLWAEELDDPDRLREYARSANPLIRRSVACNQHLPADVLDLLREDDDFPVRILLCENQASLDPDYMLEVHDHPGTPNGARWAIWQRPNFPRERFPYRPPVPADPDSPQAEEERRLLDEAGVPRL